MKLKPLPVLKIPFLKLSTLELFQPFAILFKFFWLILVFAMITSTIILGACSDDTTYQPT